MKGYIHSFESLAAVDGLGLLCAVFLSGCPLRCVYCHNPDTWEGSGDEIDAETLVKKIARFKPYFKEQGGVTFSGGEPLLQAPFIKECVSLLKKQNINYAIDTSGSVDLTDDVRFVLENAQTVILDLKFWDDESYIRFTGRDMSRTIETLQFLETKAKPVWVRTVVVPGINDSEDMIDRYFEHVKDVRCIERYELLAFHTMGFYKYSEMGIKNPLADKVALEKSVRDRLQRYADEKLNK